ncbi:MULTISPECIES: hypothetical protein [Aquimarina]|uniref:Uncharacterized protein n=1 Tax=Aquimarina algicola TaxID=2589995 RepID=A0A504J8E5_9FLAO|nr:MULTISPECIES: hypothetical protein [Aquimarina]TPN87166.1 hypothetical protein FHK87_06130 [Aquimarina algicola]
MEQKTKRRSPRLAEKLKKAVQNLNVDVFGYESKVTKNIINYFSKLSKETGLPQDRLVVRIFKDRTIINVAVHNQGRPVKKIPVKELITLFTNSEPSGLFNLEAKVVQGIEAFMVEFSDTHNIGVDQLQICIITSHDKVWVKGYKGIDLIKDIPLGVLIKHFTQ